MDELAIRVEDVSKVYKLYNRPSERLIDALGLAKKGRFKDHPALVPPVREVHHFKDYYRRPKPDERRGGD